MAHLALRTVSKRFGETVAVDDVSIEVADGEFVVLVGPSGCGKTTTLRMLAGLEAPSGGRVEIDGADVTGVPAKDRGLAMVFQSYALYPHMTVGETIGFALRLQGLAREEIARRVRAAAERLEIGALLERKPRELSGGQRQRVAVARCIVREPHAFLFDEPLSNLDAKLRATARVEIAKLQKDLGVTSVYVTHDQVEAMTMADRIVLMEAGRIRQVGAPMTLYADPDDVFVAGFLGAPAMNLVAATARLGPDGTVADLGGVEVALPVRAAGAVTLGLRPEALALGAGGDLALRAEVAHVERLGAETLLELRPEIGGLGTLRLRQAGAQPVPALGTVVTLGAQAADILVFDAEGRRLRP